jgi:hypothetical protein
VFLVQSDESQKLLLAVGTAPVLSATDNAGIAPTYTLYHIIYLPTKIKHLFFLCAFAINCLQPNKNGL